MSTLALIIAVVALLVASASLASSLRYDRQHRHRSQLWRTDPTTGQDPEP